jgi:outer membrane immunogenic protein
MKRFVLGIVALAAMAAGPAMAADMPVKAPAPAAVSYYDWTGVYLAAGIGTQRTKVDWAYTNPSPATCCAPFSDTYNDTNLGGFAGAQIQWGWLVVGVEAGASSATGSQYATGQGCVAPNSFTIACQARISSAVLTAGGKLGIAWGNWLFYGDGGYATAQIHSQLRGGPPGLLTFDGTARTHNGWYAGAGLDYVIYKGVLVDAIVGLEYQHVDLEQRVHLSVLDGYAVCPPGVNCRNLTAKEDIFRARLAIKTHAWDFLRP